MTTPSLSREPRADGFSLLEVVIAASLLLLTVTSVTAAVTSVSHAGRRADAAMRVDGALGSVISRLASLPFCAPALPALPSGDCTSATDLLAAVFPDAGAPRDTAAARYVEADGDGVPAGSFVTHFDQGGVLINCVARFRAEVQGSYLGPADLTGWDLVVSGRPPAPLLEVEVSASADGVARMGLLVREAGTDPVPSPPPTATVGS